MNNFVEHGEWALGVDAEGEFCERGGRQCDDDGTELFGMFHVVVRPGDAPRGAEGDVDVFNGGVEFDGAVGQALGEGVGERLQAVAEGDDAALGFAACASGFGLGEQAADERAVRLFAGEQLRESMERRRRIPTAPSFQILNRR